MEVSSLRNDYDSSQHFRWRTLIYVRSCLGLSISPAEQKVVNEELDTAITSFRSVGDALRCAYTPGMTVQPHSVILTDDYYREATATS